MNRTDRLLAIVLELQGKGHQRAEDLAGTFETSKRTIYRDIQALGQAGVPLISTPGRGYSLMKGYFLPPLSFTTDEATMLLLGSDFMAQNFDAQYRAAAQSASRKIEGVLPEKLREEVHYLQNSIRFVSGDALQRSPRAELLQQLRRAIIQRTIVRFHYHTRRTVDGKSEQNRREANPYGLIHSHGAWHLVAWCHLRHDMRIFRLDRMENLELLPDIFDRPAGFTMRDGRSIDARTLVIRVLFDHEVARWVQESPSFYTTNQEQTGAGLVVTLQVRHESEVLQWLLSWSSHAYVLEPESLRSRLKEEAHAILQNYSQAVVPADSRSDGAN
jgi:predicted DNA-binding transcriptional regulator YafY